MMKWTFYPIILVLLGACSQQPLGSRLPAALEVASPCQQAVSDIIHGRAQLSAQQLKEILGSREAKELQKSEIVQDYLQYVSDPQEQNETLAFMAVMARSEGESDPKLLLAKVHDSYLGCSKAF